MSTIIELSYIAAAVLFIVGLKMLSHADTAVRGNQISAVGMLVAIVATLLDQQIVTYPWIVAGVLVGGVIGAVSAMRVPMTSMPEFVALFNGTGGLASLLVGWADYHAHAGHYGEVGANVNAVTIATYLAVLIGGVTFTGSVLAYAKLAEKIGGKPVLFRGQQWVNGLVLLAFAIAGVVFVAKPDSPAAEVAFFVAIALSFLFGVLATIPIGGADMPVVISLLNSYSGLAACAAGFVIENTVLIVSGSLVGASGIILTNIMCKAMNRSLAHVLFSGFGSATGAASAAGQEGEVKSLSAEDAYYILEAARSVVIVPGYGMAVAQAQHVVRELSDILEERGAEVKFAIHPVAGRMPGHMNVLLAEADVPYEQLVEMNDINPVMPTVDVCIVIGANDVVNPAAREDPASPIFGMPVINVDYARTVFVLKRSMASGFAGIPNPLFFKENTRMLFGDAKAMVARLVAAFKEA
ncbi:MAG: NAD(P)(+) transhydrogenase (Re/Si-specific) subunit beta [Candidatus Hydrogenedentes bacterium]|nr:NAD(P)(+) transhydrogenase (Re/Si-specific) subunit beta [Candidatus Hydrogenedentota bacterium]